MSQNTRAASLPNFSQFAKKKSILLARIFAKEYKSGQNYEIVGKKYEKAQNVMFWKILLLKHVDPAVG